MWSIRFSPTPALACRIGMLWSANSFAGPMPDRFRITGDMIEPALRITSRRAPTVSNRPCRRYSTPTAVLPSKQYALDHGPGDQPHFGILQRRVANRSAPQRLAFRSPRSFPSGQSLRAGPRSYWRCAHSRRPPPHRQRHGRAGWSLGPGHMQRTSGAAIGPAARHALHLLEIGQDVGPMPARGPFGFDHSS